MLADRETNKQTKYRHVDHNTSHPYLLAVYILL